MNNSDNEQKDSIVLLDLDKINDGLPPVDFNLAKQNLEDLVRGWVKSKKWNRICYHIVANNFFKRTLIFYKTISMKDMEEFNKGQKNYNRWHEKVKRHLNDSMIYISSILTNRYSYEDITASDHGAIYSAILVLAEEEIPKPQPIAPEHQVEFAANILEELVETALEDHLPFCRHQISFEDFCKERNMINEYAKQSMQIIYDITSYELRVKAMRDFLRVIIRQQLIENDSKKV